MYEVHFKKEELELIIIALRLTENRTTNVKREKQLTRIRKGIETRILMGE